MLLIVEPSMIIVEVVSRDRSIKVVLIGHSFVASENYRGNLSICVFTNFLEEDRRDKIFRYCGQTLPFINIGKRCILKSASDSFIAVVSPGRWYICIHYISKA